MKSHSQGIGNIRFIVTSARLIHLWCMYLSWSHLESCSFAPEGSCLRLSTKGGRIKVKIHTEFLSVWIPNFKIFFDDSRCTKCARTYTGMYHLCVKCFTVQRERFSLPKRLVLQDSLSVKNAHQYSPSPVISAMETKHHHKLHRTFSPDKWHLAHCSFTSLAIFHWSSVLTLIKDFKVSKNS